MSSLEERISEFNLVGQLLGFIIKEGYKIKYLRIAFKEHEYWIKPDHEIREELIQTITPGCWVEIQGIAKQSLKTGKLKLKANSVQRVAISTTCQIPVTLPQSQAVKSETAKASILICQKSDCWKRGGKEVCQVLEKNLRDRDLADKVQIKLTGCLKQCKHGPNVVVMPDKARYSQVTPECVTPLLEKHFAGHDQLCPKVSI
jgi:(2Fe-2S) ferredoxin